ncbi:MAG: tRNA pseudouridine(13) synthase TruD [candidate division WOR-3 bacterium]
MKIKVIPEDFRVEEKINLKITSQGQYSIYRLEKRNWSTLDLIDYLKRNYRLVTIRYAGLKDRYAHSIQYVSIIGDGPNKIQEENFSLTYLGKSDHPVTRDYLLGNFFSLTLRDLTESDITKVKATLKLIERDGLPNYYDEQRFGSIRHKKGFFTHKLLLKHFNGALKLYMATPSAFDDSKTRELKKFFANHWGDWQTLKSVVEPIKTVKEFRPILNHLIKKPNDFKGAIRQMNRPILELLIVAYQSYLWNEILAGLLRSLKLKLYAYPYSAGNFLFYSELPNEMRNYLATLLIPTPSPKAVYKSEKIERITNEVLWREGLVLKDLKLPIRVRGIFLKPFDRTALFFLENLKVIEPELDERYPNKLKLKLNFFLPKGSYATILVKRLQLAIEPKPVVSDEPIESGNESY